MQADRSPARAARGEPLAVLAAGGRSPIEVAQAAQAAGRDVMIVGLEGEADEGIAAFPHAFVKWGQIGRIESIVRAHGARDIVMIGTVSVRPDFRAVAVDLGTLRYLPKLIRAMVGGDDKVLANFSRYIEGRGFRLVGVAEVAPGMVPPSGPVIGQAPEGTTADDARLAYAAALAIGRLDAGQSAVVVNGRVASLEAAEGTDAMLERVAVLRDRGRMKWAGRAGVVAKCAKPQQDLRLDMPAIGPVTVEKAAAAGLAGIVIQAGGVMTVDRTALAAAAERSGMFVFAADGNF
jgi:UDP-2,3-diacylglucosamine hydrolase